MTIQKFNYKTIAYELFPVNFLCYSIFTKLSYMFPMKSLLTVTGIVGLFILSGCGTSNDPDQSVAPDDHGRLLYSDTGHEWDYAKSLYSGQDIYDLEVSPTTTNAFGLVTESSNSTVKTFKQILNRDWTNVASPAGADFLYDLEFTASGDRWISTPDGLYHSDPWVKNEGNVTGPTYVKFLYSNEQFGLCASNKGRT